MTVKTERGDDERNDALRGCAGGPEFIQRCVSAAADLALFFAGVPNDAMLVSLAQTRERLTVALSEAFGAEVASLIAQSFVAAVAGRKAELERADANQNRQIQ